MELTVTTFVTMDGVMQGPGAPDEDRSNGFDQGGWLVPFLDEDFGEIMEGWFARADEILLGRTTYDMMSAYWPQVTGPDHPDYGVTAEKLNNQPKHIASRTLRNPEWKNASVIEGDVVEAVRTLKDKPGGELQVHGSAGLLQTLNQYRLVDEYRLLVAPVVLGSGKRLFGDGTVPTGLRTAESRTTGTGLVALTLRSTGTPTIGRQNQDGTLTLEQP